MEPAGLGARDAGRNRPGEYVGFVPPQPGQIRDVYWTFVFIWRDENPDEDVDRFPPAQPGFHFRPPTRTR